jgi:hypothetical protein
MALRGVSVKLAVSMVLMLALGWRTSPAPRTGRCAVRGVLTSGTGGKPQKRPGGRISCWWMVFAGGGGADGGLRVLALQLVAAALLTLCVWCCGWRRF